MEENKRGHVMLKEEWELGLAKRVSPLSICQKRGRAACEKIGLGYSSIVRLIRPKKKRIEVAG